MKIKNSSILTRLTLAFGLLFLMTACSEDVVPEGTSDNKMLLNLNIKIDNGSSSVALNSRSMTRAEEWYFEGPASKYEGVKTLRIIIYRKSHGIVEYNRLINIPEGSQLNDVFGPTQFRVEGGEMKGIYLVANEESLSPANVTLLKKMDAGSQFDALLVSEMTIDTPADGEPIVNNDGTTTAKYVPMSETFDVIVDKPSEEVPSQDVTLFLTRAAVKFSFEIDPASYLLSGTKNLNSFRVSEIKVSNIANSEYMLPYNTTYDPIKEQEADERVITAYACPENVAVSDITFHPENFGQNRDSDRVNKSTQDDTGEDDHSTYEPSSWSSKYIPFQYFAESPIPKDGFFVSVKVLEDHDSEAFELGPVKLPNLPSLPRNTHVRVIMKFSEHGLSCTYVLMPYIGIVLEPVFGL